MKSRLFISRSILTTILLLPASSFAVTAGPSCEALFGISIAEGQRAGPNSSSLAPGRSSAPTMGADADSARLLALRQVFGNELKEAREFDVSRTAWVTTNWLRYGEMDIAFWDWQSSYGILIVRTREANPHYYTLDARLPLARQIIESRLISQPPLHYVLSSDGRYFVEDGSRFHNRYDEGATLYQPENPSAASGGTRIDGRLAWPTVETLNQLHGLDPAHAPTVFVRSVNARMSAYALYWFTHELMEHLAAGEIPVVQSRWYGWEVEHAIKLYDFTHKPEWPQLQAMIRQALDLSQDADLNARTRFAAEQTLSQLFREVANALYPKANPLLSNSPMAERLLSVNAKLLELENQARETRALPKLSDGRADGREQSRSQLALGSNANQATPPARSSLMARARSLLSRWAGALATKPESAPSNRWQSRRRQGDLTHLTSPLRLSSKDLALFLDDQVFREVYEAKGTDYSFIHWVKGQITQDFESSGYSIVGERIQLKIWIYRHIPELIEVRIDPQLTGPARIEAWERALDSAVGPEVLLARVPLNQVNSYQSQAMEIYFKLLFGDAFSDRKWNSSDSYSSSDRTHGPEWAYRDLGVAVGASETEIKAAYRRLAMKLHPDRTDFDKNAEERLKRVNRAYSELSGKTLRQNERSN